MYCPDGYCAQKAYKVRKADGAPPRARADFALQCVECGSNFIARKADARWCSPSCRGRMTGREAARRRSAGAGAEPYTDREIFERDGWRCYLCGKRVKRTAARTDPNGATIDHIVPLSRGGVDAPSNVATAHWRCNREKRARLVDFQLRIV
jgi:hypothetical protein